MMMVNGEAFSYSKGVWKASWGHRATGTCSARRGRPRPSGWGRGRKEAAEGKGGGRLDGGRWHCIAVP